MQYNSGDFKEFYYQGFIKKLWHLKSINGIYCLEKQRINGRFFLSINGRIDIG